MEHPARLDTSPGRGVPTRNCRKQSENAGVRERDASWSARYRRIPNARENPKATLTKGSRKRVALQPILIGILDLALVDDRGLWNRKTHRPVETSVLLEVDEPSVVEPLLLTVFTDVATFGTVIGHFLRISLKKDKPTPESAPGFSMHVRYRSRSPSGVLTIPCQCAKVPLLPYSSTYTPV